MGARDHAQHLARRANGFGNRGRIPDESVQFAGDCSRTGCRHRTVVADDPPERA